MTVIQREILSNFGRQHGGGANCESVLMAGCVTKCVPFSGIGQSRGDLLVTPYGGASLMLDFTFSHSLTHTDRYTNTLQSLEAGVPLDILPHGRVPFGAIGDQASKCLGLLPGARRQALPEGVFVSFSFEGTGSKQYKHNVLSGVEADGRAADLQQAQTLLQSIVVQITHCPGTAH